MLLKPAKVQLVIKTGGRMIGQGSKIHTLSAIKFKSLKAAYQIPYRAKIDNYVTDFPTSDSRLKTKPYLCGYGCNF